MKKVLLVVVLLFTGFVLYYLVKSFTKDTKKDSRNEIVNAPTGQTTKKMVRPDDNIQHKYSMKQIDSITANLNYKFTIDNKIPDSISNPPADKNIKAKK